MTDYDGLCVKIKLVAWKCDSETIRFDSFPPRTLILVSFRKNGCPPYPKVCSFPSMTWPSLTHHDLDWHDLKGASITPPDPVKLKLSYEIGGNPCGIWSIMNAYLTRHELLFWSIKDPLPDKYLCSNQKSDWVCLCITCCNLKSSNQKSDFACHKNWSPHGNTETGEDLQFGSTIPQAARALQEESIDK